MKSILMFMSLLVIAKNASPHQKGRTFLMMHKAGNAFGEKRKLHNKFDIAITTD